MDVTTAAGRALVAPQSDDRTIYVGYIDAEKIIAIEREAVAAWIASPQAAEELARALPSPVMGTTGHGGGSYWKVMAAAILAALRDQRGAS